jgi:septal ring factor EnvC (AmiA/AmiB activator)
MPPAASVAAAQQLLSDLERRENNLRAALKKHGKQVKRSKTTAKRHRSTLKGLKKDLKKVTAARVAVIQDL